MSENVHIREGNNSAWLKAISGGSGKDNSSGSSKNDGKTDSKPSKDRK